VFLRNEPNLIRRVFERICQDDSGLERGREFFELGSFGMEGELGQIEQLGRMQSSRG
jgi:hypothetical protein